MHGIEPQIKNGLRDLPKETTQKVEPVVDIAVEPETVVKEPVKFEIEISTKQIGGDEVNAVNARELWTKLEVKTDFSDWIKGRIEKYEFVENTDYLLLKIREQLPSGAKTKNEYFISLDMAKELSMVENNEQGKKARRYFIECEKKVTNKQIEPVHNLKLSISQLNQQFKEARELAFNRGFQNGQVTHSLC